MAKKPAVADAMQAHEETFHGFLTLTKISLIALAITIVALYCLVIAAQPLIGWFLLIIVMPASIVYQVVAGTKS